jgi:hypothetical protein
MGKPKQNKEIDYCQCSIFTMQDYAHKILCVSIIKKKICKWQDGKPERRNFTTNPVNILLRFVLPVPEIEANGNNHHQQHKPKITLFDHYSPNSHFLNNRISGLTVTRSVRPEERSPPSGVA